MPILRRLSGILLTLFFACFTLLGSAGTAHAEEGYTYWNYFHLTDGVWEFSTVGAGEFVPEDGAVEGYRYGTSTTSQGITPRADLDEVSFDTVCADAEAAAGEKRVAVLVDYGVEDADAPDPRGDCAVVAEDATGQQVLETVSDLRVENSMTCALDGYPASGCGTPVDDAQVPAREEPVDFVLPATEETEADATKASKTPEDDNGLLLPLVGVGVLVVVIAGAAVAMNRRNKSAV